MESFSGYLMSFLSNHLSATFLNCSALSGLKLLQQANDARARRISCLEETLHVVEDHLARSLRLYRSLSTFYEKNQD